MTDALAEIANLPAAASGAAPERALPKMAKILATLGPSSSSLDTLVALLNAGANAFRLNCSHASMAELAKTVQTIRRAAAQCDAVCAIVMDLQGPRLRVGRLSGGGVSLKKGAPVRVTTEDVLGGEGLVPTDFKHLPRVVTKGSRILLDDGTIVLSVIDVAGKYVDCQVAVGGFLKEHKGINCPGADIDLPAITEKDMADFKMGIKLGIGHVALSFVRTPNDIRLAKEVLRRARSPMKVIAKIEHPLAIKNIDAILDEADGIMVARGDLAVELSPAEVPALQKLLVRKANEAGKLSIVATQMLESMISHPTPTRAEASDVANAVFDGADVVMLSGESAVGQYPVEAVSMMADIIRRAESARIGLSHVPTGLKDTQKTGFANALARAATDACEVTGASAVAVYTLTGWSAKVMSKYRPRAPIYALTPLKSTLHQLALYWGVRPILCPLGESTDDMLHIGERLMLKKGYLRKGQTVLISAGGTAKHRASNMLKIHVCGSLTYR